IKSGFSKCFKHISVVSRVKYDYPLFLNDLFKDFNYLSVSNNDDINIPNFNFMSNIGANIIHFVDGEYLENVMYGSIPLVSESIKYKTNDEVYFKYDLVLKKKVVLMDGIFYDKNNHALGKNLLTKIKDFDIASKNTGDFYTLMNTILNSVIQLEEKILSELG
ncbi:MAG: hypothetical protein HRU03_03400, partial [Nanoarchaeales archaeon]|nr:hypothetical protein [Nanoarchaeales archaeon]